MTGRLGFEYPPSWSKDFKIGAITFINKGVVNGLVQLSAIYILWPGGLSLQWVFGVLPQYGSIKKWVEILSQEESRMIYTSKRRKTPYIKVHFTGSYELKVCQFDLLTLNLKAKRITPGILCSICGFSGSVRLVAGSLGFDSRRVKNEDMKI